MINDFYYKILNIRDSVDISEKLKRIIEDFNKKYKDINKEQMCKFFAGIIREILLENNIDNRIFNTKVEFGTYENEVIFCRGRENKKIKYFLIDYTFSQFLYSNYYVEIINKGNSLEFFANLLKNGYVEINNESIVNYLKLFNTSIISFDLDDYFNDLNKKYKK